MPQLFYVFSSLLLYLLKIKMICFLMIDFFCQHLYTWLYLVLGAKLSSWKAVQRPLASTLIVLKY